MYQGLMEGSNLPSYEPNDYEYKGESPGTSPTDVTFRVQVATPSTRSETTPPSTPGHSIPVVPSSPPPEPNIKPLYENLLI